MMRTFLAAALASLCLSAPVRAVEVVFDYRYDSGGFFTDDRRAVLDDVARLFSSNLDDTLAAIAPTGDDVFQARIFDPVDPLNSTVVVPGLTVAADEIRIFVGARAFSGQTLGVGGPGFHVASGSGDFVALADGRGEPGALTSPPTDFAPWGGTITFGTNVGWYADDDVGTVENFAGLFDLYTVAAHETAHVLGIGTADSWFALVSDRSFIGASATAINDGVAPLLRNDGSDAHFDTSLRAAANGVDQVPLLSPVIPAGARRYMTELDWAALRDIGWEVASLQATVPAPIPEPATWGLMAGGLLLVGASVRRRAA